MVGSPRRRLRLPRLIFLLRVGAAAVLAEAVARAVANARKEN